VVGGKDSLAEVVWRCCGFTTRFERGGAHESDEQWNVRDMKV
jgi:hypothetical protein